MGISGKDRKRKQRGSAIVDAIETRRLQTHSDLATFGHETTSQIPDHQLFSISVEKLDRKNVDTIEQMTAQAKLKAMRKKSVSNQIRKSEAAMLLNPNIKPISSGRIQKSKNVETKAKARVQESANANLKPKTKSKNHHPPKAQSSSQKPNSSQVVIDLWADSPTDAITNKNNNDEHAPHSKVANHQAAGFIPLDDMIHPSMCLSNVRSYKRHAPLVSTSSSGAVPLAAMDAMSVNPLDSAHQDLLASAVADEVFKEQRQEIDRYRIGEGVLAKEQEQKRDGETRPMELMGLGIDGNEEEQEEEDEDEDQATVVHAAVNAESRKTRSQRNKEARHQELLRLQKLSGIEKRKSKQLHQLDMIIKEIETGERERVVKKSQREILSVIDDGRRLLLDQDQAKTELKPKAQGMMESKPKSRWFAGRVIPRKQVVVRLPSELTPSMRQTAVLTSEQVLKDSFVDLQHKRMIEPRKRRQNAS